MTQPSGRAPVCANCGKPEAEHYEQRSFCWYTLDKDLAARFTPTASAPPRTEAPGTCATVENSGYEAMPRTGEPPETTTWTVCQTTGRRAQQGACPVHHGDACLVVMNFSARELRSPSADTGGAAETRRAVVELCDSGHFYGKLVVGGEIQRAGCPICLREGLASLRARLAESEQTLARWRSDAEHAAGECLVPVPEPGTDMARVLIANSLMRRERDAARAALTPPEPT